MFGEKSLIEKCDTELVSEPEYFKEKNHRIFLQVLYLQIKIIIII
jgi:hypothetical protein